MASLGGAVGAKLGSRRAGNNVGKFLGKITGTGDYRVGTNSIATSSATMALDTVPQFMKRNQRETRVTHREFLGKIVSSPVAGEFSTQTFVLNPGMFGTFPWLSQIANQFDEWRPNGMVVVYKSASSTFSGTSSLGIITMATDYDVLDPPYANTVEMNNSDFAVSTNVATNLIHPIECAVKERPTRLLYTRSGPISSNDNLRWYDLGNFQVATEGCTASQVCGELWITYDISFFKAQINSQPLNINPLGCRARSEDGIDDANPFGTIQTYRDDSTLIPTIAGKRLTIPNANGSYTGRCFQLTYQIRASGAFEQVAFPVDLDFGPGMQAVNITYSGSQFQSQSGVTDPKIINQVSYAIGLKVTGIDAWFELNSVAEGSTASFVEFSIVQIPEPE